MESIPVKRAATPPKNKVVNIFNYLQVDDVVFTMIFNPRKQTQKEKLFGKLKLKLKLKKTEISQCKFSSCEFERMKFK